MFAADFKINLAMGRRYLQVAIALVFSSVVNITRVKSQHDTLRVMAYNVLHYGDGCQGSNTYLHGLLKTVVQYANPDIIGLVKVQCIKVTPSDNNGFSPYGFPDSIINNALDAAFPARYKYCTLTNVSGSNDMDLLFYDQNKMGFVSVKTICTLSEDFDLYKLYYKDPYLGATHDSTFLYFILNHTVSGNSPTQRDQQDTTIINELKKRFYHLPNIISMGDFNTHSSQEIGYEAYALGNDTNYLFYDPPFNPDHNLTYPINWDGNPGLCPGYLNTSTREFNVPNSCGANSGGKDWYEHIFISGWLNKNTNFLKYVSNSYITIGNDGNRLGISENDSTSHGRNNSASSNVVNAIFNLSDKYPIMLKLAVTFDSLGNGPINPVNGQSEVKAEIGKTIVNNPVDGNLVIHFPKSAIGERCTINCFDACGRTVFTTQIEINSDIVTQPFEAIPGLYVLRLQTNNSANTFKIIKQ